MLSAISFEFGEDRVDPVFQLPCQVMPGDSEYSVQSLLQREIHIQRDGDVFKRRVGRWTASLLNRLHTVEVPFKTSSYEAQELWDIAKAQGNVLFAGANAGLETRIDAERRWLIDDIAATDLPTFTQGQLQDLLTLLNPNRDEKMILDDI